MITIRVCDLKQRASQIIRLVRENGKEIQLTDRGEVVALLIPMLGRPVEPEAPTWLELDHLAAEIGARWPTGISAAVAIEEARR